MRLEIDENEELRPVSASLVTSGVMAVLLLILAAFAAQFPDAATEAPRTAAR